MNAAETLLVYVDRLQQRRLAQNCYVVRDRNRHAVIVDPGGEAATIIDHVRRHDLKAHAILNTHAHHDHIGAVDEVREALGTPFHLHSRDVILLKAAAAYHVVFHRRRGFRPPDVDRYLEETPTLRMGDLHIAVLETPGHSPGGVCFATADCVLTGDTLLPGRVGRVDLPGGDAGLLRASLRRLSELPLATRVFPGHGDSSTIGDQLRTNAAFREALEAAHDSTRGD
jgi:glyoxylase-like metal-dependent hydrolase (beta-lactamase superfamily II)